MKNMLKFEELAKICSYLRLNEIEIETWGLVIFTLMRDNESVYTKNKSR